MEDKGPTILAVMWSLAVLALVLVVARLCVRQRMLRNFGLDDWLIAISMVSKKNAPVLSPFEQILVASHLGTS